MGYVQSKKYSSPNFVFEIPLWSSLGVKIFRLNRTLRKKDRTNYGIACGKSAFLNSVWISLLQNQNHFGAEYFLLDSFEIRTQMIYLASLFVSERKLKKIPEFPIWEALSIQMYSKHERFCYCIGDVWSRLAMLACVKYLVTPTEMLIHLWLVKQMSSVPPFHSSLLYGKR